MKCAYTTDYGREVNVEILMELFDRDTLKVLKKAREYKGIKVTLSLKTVERAIVAKLIEGGWTDEAIQEAMSDEDRFNIHRIKRIRERINEQKQKQ